MTHYSTQAVRSALIAMLTACASGNERAANADSASPATASPATASSDSVLSATTAAGTSDLLGTWTIVGHRQGRISAMSDSAANAWHGREVRYAADASVGADTCKRASYAEQTVPVDSILAAEYNTSAAALGVTGGAGAVLRLTRTTCGGAAWTAPGATLLRFADGRAFMLWDGVFFEVRREGT